MTPHNLKGNCLSEDARARYEDICPYHDEPRGECSVCPECPECEKESDENQRRCSGLN